MSHLYKKHKWRPQAGKVGSLQDHAKQAKQISIYLYEEEKFGPKMEMPSRAIFFFIGDSR